MLLSELYSKKRKDIPKIGKLSEIDENVLKRIFSKVNNEKLEKDECWIYGKNNKISRKGSGHPQIYFDSNKNVLIHRLLYHNFIEDVPEFDNKNKNFQINHKCSHLNNGKCINPWHMYLGSHKDNMNDSKKENTFNKIKHPGWGKQHHNSKFTNEDIENMKKLRNEGKSYKEIGILYNTSSSYVSQIYNGCRRKKG